MLSAWGKSEGHQGGCQLPTGERGRWLPVGVGGVGHPWGGGRWRYPPTPIPSPVASGVEQSRFVCHKIFTNFSIIFHEVNSRVTFATE